MHYGVYCVKNALQFAAVVKVLISEKSKYKKVAHQQRDTPLYADCAWAYIYRKCKIYIPWISGQQLVSETIKYTCIIDVTK